MTSCTADWRETNPGVGDPINADFTWTDAIWHQTGEFYCDMSIYDPTGAQRAYYVEDEWNEGSHTLTINFANIPGEWTCTIRVWDGSAFVVCNDYVLVSGVGTLCSANWRETDPEVDDIINADFTWSNARQHPSSGIYCSMGIYDPDGFLVDAYDEEVEETGSYTLSVVADVAGDWTCLIAAWTGSAWLYASDIVYVSPGGSGGCIGNIVWGESTFYTGPFAPGTLNQLVATVAMINNGDEWGRITCNLYEYPGTADENLLAHYAAGYDPGSTGAVYFREDIPNQTEPWPLGVKVWCDAEPEPPWGSAQAKIF